MSERRSDSTLTGRWLKPALFAAGACAALGLDQLYGWSASLPDFLRELAALGHDHFWYTALLYVSFTVIGCVLLALPGATFAILAGVLFEPFAATVLCLLATTLAASLAFLLARYFLRGAVRPWLLRHRLLRTLLLKYNGSNGVLVLMITRLVPLFPYNLQNFAFGLTDIGFWRYTTCTFLFMLPGVAMFTVGTAAFTAEDLNWGYLAAAGGLLMVVLGAGWYLQKRYVPNSPAPLQNTSEVPHGY